MLKDLSGTILEKRTRAATDSQLRKLTQNSHHAGNMEARAASSRFVSSRVVEGANRGRLAFPPDGSSPTLDVFLSTARPLLAVLCQQRRR